MDGGTFKLSDAWCGVIMVDAFLISGFEVICKRIVANCKHISELLDMFDYKRIQADCAYLDSLNIAYYNIPYKKLSDRKV